MVLGAGVLERYAQTRGKCSDSIIGVQVLSTFRALLVDEVGVAYIEELLGAAQDSVPIAEQHNTGNGGPSASGLNRAVLAANPPDAIWTPPRRYLSHPSQEHVCPSQEPPQPGTPARNLPRLGTPARNVPGWAAGNRDRENLYGFPTGAAFFCVATAADTQKSDAITKLLPRPRHLHAICRSTCL